jgi:7-cyano-7-deazaguanine synthase in queuosine biosynthesis
VKRIEMFRAVTSYWFNLMQLGLERKDVTLRPPYNESTTRGIIRLDPTNDIADFVRWQLNGASLDHEFQVDLKEHWLNGDFNLGEITTKVRNNFKLAIAFSGGLDSAIAALYAVHELGYRKQDVVLVHVLYGAPYTQKEYVKVKSLYDNFMKNRIAGVLCHQAGGLTILPEQMGKGYIVPLRNTAIASVCAAWAPNVWIVSNYRPDDSAPGAAIDKGRRFYGEVSSILSRQYGHPVNVSSPFLHWSKADSVRWAAKILGEEGLMKLIDNTTSCYHPTEVRCHRCFACAKFAMMCASLDLEVPGFELKFMLQQPEFLEYLSREVKKGRSLPPSWQALLP